MTEIKIAGDQWDEDIEGNLLTWIYDDGASVTEGDTIVEIMVEKLQVELAAPKTGVLRHGKAEGDLVKRGEVIGQIEAS